MSEMALNLTLYTKLESMDGIFAEMQKSLRIVADGEKYADLVITVNEDQDNECVYLIELKYAAKTDATESRIQNLIKEASDGIPEQTDQGLCHGLCRLELRVLQKAGVRRAVQDCFYSFLLFVMILQ